MEMCLGSLSSEVEPKSLRLEDPMAVRRLKGMLEVRCRVVYTFGDGETELQFIPDRWLTNMHGGRCFESEHIDGARAEWDGMCTGASECMPLELGIMIRGERVMRVPQLIDDREGQN